MERMIVRLALAGALTVSLSAGATLLASRSAAPPAQTAQEQPVARTGSPATGGGGLLQNPVAPAGRLTVLVELQQDPGAIAYAVALERSPARDATALASAATAGRQQLAAVAAEQARVGAALTNAPFNATELFRVQRAMNAIAVTVDAATLNTLRRLPGVKAVHPLELEYPMNSSSVPFVGAPALWDNSLGLGLNVTGAGIRVGIIDTGIDYQHATFGGTGLLADYQANDRAAAPDAYFPTAKVVDGWDFAGDSYTGGNAPAPDADPMDCNGHGTHVAGTAAGYGVTTAGATFAGPFGLATPFSSLRIGPGTAPQASLYALRVFGCGGGTNLTIQAIDWAMDPNGDSDLTDRLDVINMSLGSNFGGLTSSTAIAADNAARAGVVVVTSAGNSGDTYFISGSPGSANRAIATAASIDDGQPGAGLIANAPAGIAGGYVAGSANFGPVPPTGGVTGNVVLALDPADGAGPLTTDGCSPLTNAAAIAGNIALIDRGTCGFIVKVKSAQDAGAIAAIIANSSAGAFGNMGGTEPPAITIPSVMVTFADGNTLKANIATLNATLVNGADGIASFSSRGPRGGSSRIVLKPDLAAPGFQIVSAQTGVTCTGAAGSAGCLVQNPSGFLSDGQPLTLNGTSMAAPHVAGIMALLRQLHPSWTGEELKALVMNRALHDVTLVPHAEPRVGPGRIGAGRVDATLAAQSSVVAFNADEPGMVSLSFEGAVTGTVSRQKKLRLVNHGATAQTYDLAVDAVVDAPGVSFSTPGASSVTVPAGQSVELTVQMDADATQMDHTRDATVGATQQAPSAPASVASLGAVARHWLTEEGSYLVLSQAGSPRIRVPLYTTPAPTSDMSAPSAIVTGGAPTGSSTIPLSGTDVCTGTLGGGPSCTGTFPNDVVSLVSPFELQVSSPTNPAQALPRADLQYVGVAYDAAADQILFGVSTWGPWKTPTDTAFGIYVDCGVYTLVSNLTTDTCDGSPDGIYDLMLFNTNPGTLSALFGTSGVNPQDSFLTAVFGIARSAVLFGPPNYPNRVSSAVADTRVFDNQVMFLAADRTRLKISSATGMFRYRVVTCAGTNPLCGQAGSQFDEAPGPYTWNYLVQGFNFGDSSLSQDLNGASIPVTWNTANLTTNGSLGVLLLHHHNGEGSRAEVALLDTGLQTDLAVGLTASSTTPAIGEQITLTVTVTNNGPAAASGVEVLLDLPSQLTYVNDDGAGAYDPGLGKWTLPGPLAASGTSTLQIVVFAETSSTLNARASVGAAAPLDPNPGNNVATLGVMSPSEADVQITTAAVSGPTVGGNPVQFTVTVTNTGVDPTYNLVISESIVAGAGAITGGTPSVGLFNFGTGQWAIASLGIGASATLTVDAIAVSGPLFSLRSQVTASVVDLNLANNTSTASIAIAARPTTLTVDITPSATALVDEARNAVVTVTDTAGSGAPGNPTGTVTFSSPQADTSLTPASCTLAPVAATPDRSSCQIVVRGAASGAHAVNASYPGTVTHSASTGSGSLAVDARPTSTTANNATATQSATDQTVLLTAIVTGSLQVDSGVVTFTVKDAANATVGVPVASAPMTTATASASYTLPGGTPAQTLTIVADYTEGVRFAASSDATKTLIVSEAPNTTRTYTLAEGATGAFFDTRILLANPNATEAPVTIAFVKEDATTITIDRTLTPMSRSTIVVREIAGLEATTMSTQVTSTSGLPLVVERTMRWDATGYGAHTEKAEEGGSTTWYFAEGAQGFFSTFLLLENPQGAVNTAHVTYFREGQPPLDRDYPVEAMSRETVDLSTEPGLASTSFGARVTFDQPGFAERATYFGTTPIWTGGHASSGARALSSSWLFAEGATGSYFSTFLLIANPNAEAAEVTVTYLPAGGSPVTKSHPLPGGQRLTLNIAAEDPSLATGAVGARVESDRPVVAERAVYWPQPDWIEGHSSIGVTAAGGRWGLAEGSVGGAGVDQTYILLVNPGALPTEVTATFLRASGLPIIKRFTLEGNERRNIWVGGVGSDVPELTDETFGTLIESPQPIVVERSLYSNVGGVVWAAGTNATGTPLLVPVP